jgi:hypothetical protein
VTSEPAEALSAAEALAAGVAGIAAQALIQAAGDPTAAIGRLEAMRSGGVLVASAGDHEVDLITLAQESVNTAAEELEREFGAG